MAKRERVWRLLESRPKGRLWPARALRQDLVSANNYSLQWYHNGVGQRFVCVTETNGHYRERVDKARRYRRDGRDDGSAEIRDERWYAIVPKQHPAAAPALALPVAAQSSSPRAVETMAGRRREEVP